MTELFIGFGVPIKYSMLPVGGIYLIATFLGIFVASGVIETYGRRPLLLTAILVDLVSYWVTVEYCRIFTKMSKNYQLAQGQMIETTDNQSFFINQSINQPIRSCICGQM